MKSYIKDISKNVNLGIAIKSKKTSSWLTLRLKPAELEILSYVTIIHQPVIVSSNMHMQPNTCTNEAFSSTSTRFNPKFGWFCRLYVLYQPKLGLNLVDVLENASFVHVFGYMCMFELTITGWWIIIT